MDSHIDEVPALGQKGFINYDSLIIHSQLFMLKKIELSLVR